MCSFIFVVNCLDGRITQQHTWKRLSLIKSVVLTLHFGSCFTCKVYTQHTTWSFKYNTSHSKCEWINAWHKYWYVSLFLHALSLFVVSLFSTLVVVVSSQYHHSNINAKHQTTVQCLCLYEFIISSVIHIYIVYKLIVCVCINEESYVYLWRFTQTLWNTVTVTYSYLCCT